MKFVPSSLSSCCKSIKHSACFRHALFSLFIRLNDTRKMVVPDMSHCTDELHFSKLLVVWMCMQVQEQKSSIHACASVNHCSRQQ